MNKKTKEIEQKNTTKNRSGSETRKRQHSLSFRVNDEERKQIENDAARAGLTIASYLRKLAISAPVPRQGKRPPIEKKELAKILGQIGKIGSNINQIARAANANIPYSIEGLKSELISLQKVKNDIRQALGKQEKAKKNKQAE